MVIPEEELRRRLEAVRSPLSPFAAEPLQSPYWSLLIAITAAEQSYSIQPASSPYNLWGRMYPRCCILKKYASFPEAIADMDLYFRDYWEGRRNVHTVEDLNGKYCVNEAYAGNQCPGWTERVLKAKRQFEAL